MGKNLIANASISVHASDTQVWKGLTDPEIIKKYMMGASVDTDWQEGSAITWSGEFNGKKYQDKGRILEIEPKKKLKYSHFSALSGQEDTPENYHTVTIHLSGDQQDTTVSLSQDKNGTEKEKEESQKNWTSMLEGLKKTLEAKSN